MPLGRHYTLGVRFFIGRTHAAALLPEVMPLIEQRRLRPEAVTTRIVEWDAAAAAYGEPAITSSAEANHLGPQASADELARAVDRSLCERSSGIMTDCLCEPAVRMGGSASGSENYHPSAIVERGVASAPAPSAGARLGGG